MAAVKDRLTKEIGYWDYRLLNSKIRNLQGEAQACLNSGSWRGSAADELSFSPRLQKRLAELEQERRLSPLPPVVLGGRRPRQSFLSVAYCVCG